MVYRAEHTNVIAKDTNNYQTHYFIIPKTHLREGERENFKTGLIFFAWEMQEINSSALVTVWRVVIEKGVLWRADSTFLIVSFICSIITNGQLLKKETGRELWQSDSTSCLSHLSRFGGCSPGSTL